MSGIARVSDTCTGHDGFPPRESISGSPNVRVNGLPVHRIGDNWETHCNSTCHDSILGTGSTKMRVNGLFVGRVGDTIECGSSVATGSLNVFVGE